MYLDLEGIMRKVPPPPDLPVSQTENPYWDIVRTIPGNGIDWKYDRIWAPDWTATYFDDDGRLLPPKQHIDRNELNGEYTWAIPDPISLEFVAKWLAPKAVEMGAGTGYWCWQLTQLGVDMLAFDKKPPNKTINHWHSPRTPEGDAFSGEMRQTYHEVRQGTPLQLRRMLDRTLFLSWPPMDTMAALCLKHYQGKRVVYIGEGDGGCTATSAFFEQLEAEWKEVAEHRIVQWWSIHDYITVYEREKDV